MSGAPLLPYGRQWIDEADVDAVREALRADFLTQGPTVGAFEAALCAATGSPHAAAVASGTAALHLGALALDVAPGQLGLTSPITFVASANALRYVGARVGLVDVDPASGLITPETLGEALAALAAEGRTPSLVVPVDLSGQPVDLPTLSAQAARAGARVLHDAAHSLGATYRAGEETCRVGSGRHADATILSFHPVKHITTGEGGALLTPHDAVHARACELRSHGIHREPAHFSRASDDPFVGPWYYEQRALGFHYRLPDLNCALGLSQLRKLGAFVARRQALAQQYDAGLAERGLLEHLAPLTQRAGAQSSYHLYVVRLRPHPGEGAAEVAARRKALYLRLRDEGILTQVHYIPVHWHEDHQRELWLPPGGLPGAEAYYAGCLSLPLFPSMRDDDISRVLAALCRAF